MKIAIAMKSNFAFDHLVASIQTNGTLNKIEVIMENVQTMKKIDDTIEFRQPDLFVVDSKLPDQDRVLMLVQRSGIPIIHFQSVDSVIEQLIAYFSLDSVDEEDREEEENNSSRVTFSNPRPTKEIVYEKQIVEKEIIKTAYSSIPNKLIVVGSMWSGAGSTTLAVNLARAIAERGIDVAYVEYPLLKPYMFDYLQIHMKETPKKAYVDFAKEIKQKKIIRQKNRVWTDAGIQWHVIDSRHENSMSFGYEEMIKLVYSINSTITIVDVSNHLNDPHIQNFTHQADELFVCVEPDPIKTDWLSTTMINSKESKYQREEKKTLDFLKELESTEGINYQLVAMKYTKKIDAKTWLEALVKKPITHFSYIPYEDHLMNVWKSTIIYDDKRYHEDIEKAMKPLLVKIIPKSMYNINKKQNKSLTKVIKLFAKKEDNE